MVYREAETKVTGKTMFISYIWSIENRTSTRWSMAYLHSNYLGSNSWLLPPTCWIKFCGVTNSRFKELPPEAAAMYSDTFGHAAIESCQWPEPLREWGVLIRAQVQFHIQFMISLRREMSAHHMGQLHEEQLTHVGKATACMHLSQNNIFGAGKEVPCLKQCDLSESKEYRSLTLSDMNYDSCSAILALNLQWSWKLWQ